MNASGQAPSTRTAPEPRLLSAPRVVFLVIAAAAPMAAMGGNIPLALVRSEGITLPAAYVLAAVDWSASPSPTPR